MIRLKVSGINKYMNKILCPQCNGRRTVIDKEAAIFTLGVSLIFKFREDDGRKKCPTCKGKAFI